MQQATATIKDQTESAPNADAIRKGILERREAFEAMLPDYMKRGARPVGRLNALDRENNDLLLDSM